LNDLRCAASNFPAVMLAIIVLWWIWRIFILTAPG
jgi:hypothetical protein